MLKLAQRPENFNKVLVPLGQYRSAMRCEADVPVSCSPWWWNSEGLRHLQTGRGAVVDAWLVEERHAAKCDETQTGYVENGQEWLGQASNMGRGLAQIALVQEARGDDFRQLCVNDIRKTE